MSKDTEMTEKSKLRQEEETVMKEEAASQTSEKSDKKASSVTVTTNRTESKLALMTKEDIKALDYNDFSTPARMLALGEALVKSKLVQGKTADDVMASLMLGQELGLPVITSISQVYVIEGKPTLGVHIIRSIILREKILFEKLEDAETIYSFVKVDEQGKLLLEETFKGTLSEQPENTKKKPIDTRTTYKFIRMVKMPNGEYREQVVKSSFSIAEATSAGLLEKANWKKYPKRMLDARAFAIGAREIADDLINGVYTHDEMGATSFINDEGHETVEIPHVEVMS